MSNTKAKALIGKLLHCQASDDYAAVPKELFSEIVQALEPVSNSDALYAFDDLLAECSLYGIVDTPSVDIIRAAISERDAMHTQLKMARKALEPFEEAARELVVSNNDIDPIKSTLAARYLTCGDLRRAASVLTAIEGGAQ